MSEPFPNEDIDIDEIVDDNGEVRRLGTLAPPADLVSSFPVYEDTNEVWEMADIIKAAKNPDKKPAELIFGDEWMQNQFSHGSCAGYAGAGGFGKTRFKRGIQDKRKFSGAWLYSLVNGGRDNGSMPDHVLRKILEVGVCFETTVPWDQIYPRQQPANAKIEAAKYKGIDGYVAKTIEGLYTGMARGLIAFIVVHAGRNFQRLNDKGVAGVDSGSGNHAIHADELVHEGGDLFMKGVNSWGLQYGRRGRAKLHRSSIEQPWRNHRMYLLGSTIEKT